MKKVLVTGASGFLASRITAYLEECGEVNILAPSHAELDITSQDSCHRWFSTCLPDAVLHMAAISDIGECDRNPDLSWKVNVEGPVNLAQCAAEYGLTGRFLFASSDQVYTANMTDDRINRETDTLSPTNLYGREKMSAEEQVLNVLPTAVALRFAWMFDLKPGKTNYIKKLISTVKSQQPTAFAVNELRGESYAYEVAQNIRLLMNSDVQGGAYNFGSPASGSSYVTAVRALEAVGETLRMPVKGLAVPVQYSSPRSLAMDQTKLNDVGIRFRNTVEAVEYCLDREKQNI